MLRYQNPALPVEKRVADLLQRMTLEEKVALLAGSAWMETVPNARLGIPSIKMADGPMGVRCWAGPDVQQPPQVHSTAFPSNAAMAAAWDPELARAEGKAIGQEVKGHGRNMILGPTVNIDRVPLWGRNFEGFGEDPYLAARLAVAYIQGVQSEGVIATVKHFAANNQEFERHRIDEKIDERTLNEIYYPAFKAAVQEAGVWAVMSAYNKIDGLWCAENQHLLREVLKKEWGFRGFVVSDWGSTYSTVDTVNAGMDLEMPGGEAMRYWTTTEGFKVDGNGAGFLTPDKVLPAVASGKISPATIDDNAGRILRVMFQSGVFDKPTAATGQVDTPEHRALARKIAEESIVLLKNAGGILPLDASKVHSIAVIGPNAAVARTGGGGSSMVNPSYAVAPLDGLRERAGSKVRISYALGVPMQGEPFTDHTPAAQAKLRKEAAALAAQAEVAIVVVGYAPFLEREDFDRATLDLPEGQDELIQAVTKVNKNTIVVVNAGSPVSMSKWLDQAAAVLDMWYGGQEGGHAIASILFGDANPSGKLPVTFPKEMKDSAAYGHYPGTNLHVEYAEGIYVGYRHFDAHQIEPLFPFGYGLSYTKFEYSGLKVTPATVAPGQKVTVALQVRNTGERAGAEVVQLYLHDVKSSLPRPPQELKRFRRVALEPGAEKTVTFVIDQPALSFYSPEKHAWVAEPGVFEVLVGASSRDIRLKGAFTLGQ
jgi:beta-glucosidase